MAKKLQFGILSPNGKAPTRATKHSVGWDLYSSVDVTIRGHDLATIPSDLSFVFPEGYYGQLFDRSSMAKKKIHVFGGVIDPDFTGNVRIMLFNSNDSPVEIKRHQKIVQMVLLPAVRAEPEEQTLDEIGSHHAGTRMESRAGTREVGTTTEDDSRGSKGFGSSGDF